MPLFYRSEYVNLGVSGATEAGAELSLVMGKHERNFPYHHAESGWDDLLLCVGDERVSTQARRLDFLRIAVDVRGPDTGTGRLVFDGPVTRALGGDVHLRLDLRCSFVRFPPYQLAKRYNLLDALWVPGLRWRPFELSIEGGQSIELGDRTIALRPAFGELEHGVTTNLRWKRAAFMYDFLCLATTTSDKPYALVRFISRALDKRGFFGRLLDAYLRATASETLTFAKGTVLSGDEHGASTQSDGAEVLIEHVIPLGLADLQRQVVRTVDASGHSVVGLREIFTPRRTVP